MNEIAKKIDEGWMKKGGRNPKPSSPRPSKPPSGQSPKRGGRNK